MGRRRERRIRRTMSLLGLGLVIGLSAAAGGQRGPAPTPVGYRWQVRPGDTLWALAGWMQVPEADRRELVWLLKQVNGLRGVELHPGQRLVLPVGEAACRAARRDPAGFADRAQLVSPDAIDPLILAAPAG